ncbi:hypothetical protein GCM10010307_46330 [Streptomyces vastus]|uniref:Uncharacterized protein n=1 Tax=Streptomyces vastus TaxID=285451 RepID=A0ABN3R3Q0_9ACTN
MRFPLGVNTGASSQETGEVAVGSTALSIILQIAASVGMALTATDGFRTTLLCGVDGAGASYGGSVAAFEPVWGHLPAVAGEIEDEAARPIRGAGGGVPRGGTHEGRCA